ncbi:MAG: T9SS type A sorting domain-containing protein [Lentimicrobium sp.]|nr:T9SS type A sorting domain-containing protein [Lentimicrobium sp.]
MKRTILLLLSFAAALWVSGQTPGTLDTSFGNQGITLIDWHGDNNSAEAIRLLPDGGMLLCGNNGYLGTANNCSVVKLLADGLPDPAFGTDGKIEFDYGGDHDFVYDMAILPDNKFIVCGGSISGNNASIALAKFTETGLPDPSFGNNGIAVHHFSDFEFAFSILLLDNGRFAVAGYIDQPDGDRDLLVCRFLSNGALDPAFGTNGKFMADLQNGSSDFPRGMALHNGKILICAYAFNGNSDNYDAIALVRLTTAGVFDVSFGIGGKSINDGFDFDGGLLMEAGTSLAIDYQNRIVVSATSRGIAGDYATLLRFQSNGYPDNSFGDYGTEVYLEPGDVALRAVAVQPDGKILAAGRKRNGSAESMLLMRVLENGALDPQFGAFNGYAVFGISTGTYRWDMTNAMAITPGQKAILAGRSYTPETSGDFTALCVHLGNIVDVDAPEPDKNPFIFPNPVVNNTLQLNQMPANGPLNKIIIYDASGREIAVYHLSNNQPDAHQPTVHLPEHLPAGLYMLRTRGSHQQPVSLPFIKP